MKLTRSWIDEFVTLPTRNPEELIEVFESLGHEVENWHDLEAGFRGVVVGKVTDITRHPNADKVRLTRVDIGDEVLDIVCGAWNFEVGAIVPVAVPGAVLDPSFEIARREIRGVTSNGMICSETELGLGDDADGIMVLDAPHGFVLGGDFAAFMGLPDVHYEINVTPNRPDCLSVYGLCRDLAAYFQVPLRGQNIDLREGGARNDITVTIDVPELCGRFAGRRVRGVRVGPSPHWMRWRLMQAGIRPISNVVDASNYAMIEFGYPTHAFDVDRLGTTIQVRLTTDGETIVTLDDRLRTLTGSDLVVTDGVAPVAIGGVMGGATTEVGHETTDVFIEAAYWDPATILETSKHMGLRSEASMRFERGADPSFCAMAADRVAQLLVQTAGGLPAPGPVDVNPADVRPWSITYPLATTERILGIALDPDTTSDLLRRMSFEVEGTDPLTVTVPTRRPDVRAPVDVVEEIARLHGFAGIPDTVPNGPGGGLPYEERRLRLIRQIMVGAGYHEMLTFSFMGTADVDAMNYPEGHPARTGIRVVNPLNDAEGVMRTTLLPGLAKAAASALARTTHESRLFEIGKVFLSGVGKLPEQPDRLAFILAGEPPVAWDGRGRKPTVYDATGIWEVLGGALSIPDAAVRKAEAPGFHPGRCAELTIGDVVIGTAGELHPAVVRRFDLDGPVAAGELDLAELLVDRGPWQYTAPSVFPPAIFDMAFVVSASTPARSVLDAAATAAPHLIEDMRVFDVFSGDAVGEGNKSLAIRFTLRAPDRTLTDAEAGEVRRTIVDAVGGAVGGSLRGEL
ncbi:MAG: phenylalanine--tRNA ligase subunit beta [Acidimicrobiia bacterium]